MYKFQLLYYNFIILIWVWLYFVLFHTVSVVCFDDTFIKFLIYNFSFFVIDTVDLVHVIGAFVLFLDVKNSWATSILFLNCLGSLFEPLVALNIRSVIWIFRRFASTELSLGVINIWDRYWPNI